MNFLDLWQHYPVGYFGHLLLQDSSSMHHAPEQKKLSVPVRQAADEGLTCSTRLRHYSKCSRTRRGRHWRPWTLLSAKENHIKDERTKEFRFHHWKLEPCEHLNCRKATADQSSCLSRGSRSPRSNRRRLGTPSECNPWKDSPGTVLTQTYAPFCRHFASIINDRLEYSTFQKWNFKHSFNSNLRSNNVRVSTEES